MINRLISNLREWYAVRDHKHHNLHKKIRDSNTNHTQHVLDVMPSGPELDAIEAFRNLGAQTNFRTRLSQAAQLEAHDVPSELFVIFLRIHAQGAITQAELHQLKHQGIRPLFQLPQDQKIGTAQKIHRLQNAVKRLAFIAGPGFTTDHLIDEGIINQGDI